MSNATLDVFVEFTKHEGVRLITAPTPTSMISRRSPANARHVGVCPVWCAEKLDAWKASADFAAAETAVGLRGGIYGVDADDAMRELQAHFSGFLAGLADALIGGAL